VINGRLHAHMTLATPDKAFGGRVEPGKIVFTFAIVMPAGEFYYACQRGGGSFVACVAAVFPECHTRACASD